MDQASKSSSDFVVRTMPQKFLSMRPSSKSDHHQKKQKVTGIKKTIIVGSAIVIIVGILMAIAAWLFLRSLHKESPPPAVISPIVETDNTAATDNTESEPKPTTPTPIPTDTAELLDTSQWVDFQNESYYYRLKYPSGWLKVDADGPSTVIIKQGPDSNNLTITVSDNIDQLSLSDWVDQNTDYTEQPQSFNLDSVPALKYGDDSLGYSIYISKNDNIYLLALASATEDDIITSVHNRLLANFKFIDIEPSDPEQKPAPAEPLPPTPDNDRDSLTDAEEILFKTNKAKPDTDGDTYNDALEVVNLYDPNKPGNAKLYESDVVATYVNADYQYNLLYPASWVKKDQGQEVIFQASTGEFVEITIQANDQAYYNIHDWYLDQFGDSGKNIEISGFPAIKSSDNLRVYLLFGNNIYSLIYNPGLRDDVNFMTTFSMMATSFTLMH